MNTLTHSHEQVLYIKDDKFSIDEIPNYYLNLLIGTNDLSLAIVHRDAKRCLYLEHFTFNSTYNTTQVIENLDAIFDEHHLLQARFWKGVNVGFKNQKFSLIPADLYSESQKSEYLNFSCSVVSEKETVISTKLSSVDAYAVFAGENRLIEWFKNIYGDKVAYCHEIVAFIDGIVASGESNKGLHSFVYVESDYLQVAVLKDGNLEYSNIFKYTNKEDFIYFVLYTYKELQLETKSTPITLWGKIDIESDFFLEIYKYIRNVHIGNRPKVLTFNYEFDAVPESRYFPLFNMCPVENE